MNNHEAIELVRSIFAAGERDVQLVAEELVDVALEKGRQYVCMLAELKYFYVAHLVNIDRFPRQY